jgi:hypothetical protein
MEFSLAAIHSCCFIADAGICCIQVHKYVLNVACGKLAGIFVLRYSNGNVTLIAFVCNARREFAAEGKALRAV